MVCITNEFSGVLSNILSLAIRSYRTGRDRATMEHANGSPTQPASIMNFDYLIVGTGPAGASLAAFMASYGGFDEVHKP